MTTTTISDCRIIELPGNVTNGGGLTTFPEDGSFPFAVQRIFYLYDIREGESRGNHAHIACGQFLTAAAGSFEVIFDDAIQTETVLLNHPNVGLYIPPGIWATETAFSPGAVCLVLASHGYDAADYIRDYEAFKKYKNNGKW